MPLRLRHVLTSRNLHRDEAGLPYLDFESDGLRWSHRVSLW